MRILFVTPYVPSSVRVRPWAFIRELARLGHQVTLVCLVQPSWEASYLDEVRPYCQKVYPIYPQRAESYLNSLTSLPTREPLSVAYCRSASLTRQVNELVEKNSIDLVHSEFVRSVPATAHVRDLPKVYDAVDSLGLAYRRSLSARYVSARQRMVSMVEWMKMPQYEARVIEHYDRVLVSSPVDQGVLQSRKETTVEVVQNGVDLSYFAYAPGPRQPATIVFLGKMSYYVNVSSVLWFYHEILPLIRKERPDVRFKIVGRDPTRKIQALASDAAVEVTGTIDDIRPHVAQAAVAVCPMTAGSGIQNKMLEAMALGTPCVVTTATSQSVSAIPEQDFLVRDDRNGFAEAVLKLLNSPSHAEAVALNGRKYVEQHHNWETAGRKLEAIYRQLVG